MSTRPLAAALSCFFCASAAVATPTAKTPPPHRVPQPVEPRPKQTVPQKHSPQDRWWPLRSGYGVIVGDPAPPQRRSGDQRHQPAEAAMLNDIQAFGAGCTRWLQLQLSNQMELGKMLPWTEYAALAGQVQGNNSLLSREEAKALARGSGVTHAVCTAIMGTDKKAYFVLQLAALPSGAPAGPRILKQGSLEQLNRQLPAVLRELLAGLKASGAGVPGSSGASVQTLIHCGRAPLDASQPLPPTLRYTLCRESGRTPLAALLAWRSTDDTVADAYSIDGTPLNSLLLWATDNLAVGEFMAGKRPELARPLSPRLAAALEKAAPNYLLANLQRGRALAQGKYELAQAAAERAAACMPANPAAWMWLQAALERHAHAMDSPQVRQANRTLLPELRTLRLAATQRAIELAPDSVAAWHAHGSAAYDMRDYRTFARAFWRAHELAPADNEHLMQGLYFFGPGPAIDNAALTRIAVLLADRPGQLAQAAVPVMAAIADNRINGDVAARLTEKVWHEVLLDPAGALASRPDVRNTLAAAWHEADAAHEEVEARARLSRLLGEYTATLAVPEYLEAFGPHTVYGTELISCFRLLSAQRWVALAPNDGAAWLELALASPGDVALIYAGSPNIGRSAALDKAFQLAPLDMGVNAARLAQPARWWGEGAGTNWAAIRHICDNPGPLDVLLPRAAGLLPDSTRIPESFRIMYKGSMTAEQQQLASRLLARLETLKPREDPAIQRELARYFFGKGRYTEALTAHENRLRLAPGSPAAEHELGKFLFHIQRIADGEPLSPFPEQLWIQHNRPSGASTASLPARPADTEIEAHLRRALELDAEYAPAMDTLAGCLLVRAARQEKAAPGSGIPAMEEAVTLLRHQLRRQPLSVLTRKRLECVQQRLAQSTGSSEPRTNDDFSSLFIIEEPPPVLSVIPGPAGSEATR